MLHCRLHCRSFVVTTSPASLRHCSSIVSLHWMPEYSSPSLKKSHEPLQSPLPLKFNSASKKPSLFFIIFPAHCSRWNKKKEAWYVAHALSHQLPIGPEIRFWFELNLNYQQQKNEKKKKPQQPWLPTLAKFFALDWPIISATGTSFRTHRWWIKQGPYQSQWWIFQLFRPRKSGTSVGYWSLWIGLRVSSTSL